LPSACFPSKPTGNLRDDSPNELSCKIDGNACPRADGTAGAAHRDKSQSVGADSSVEGGPILAPVVPARLPSQQDTLTGGRGTALAQARDLAPESPFTPVVLRVRPKQLEYTFDVRQQWEGVVTNVDATEFTVVLRDVRDAAAPEYEAILPLEEIAPDDLSLLVAGAVLYWTIGYQQTRAGQVSRSSTIRLRRLPSWSRRDIARVEERARELDGFFRDR
jgi:hypothetical protein